MITVSKHRDHAKLSSILVSIFQVDWGGSITIPQFHSCGQNQHLYPGSRCLPVSRNVPGKHSVPCAIILGNWIAGFRGFLVDGN